MINAWCEPSRAFPICMMAKTGHIVRQNSGSTSSLVMVSGAYKYRLRVVDCVAASGSFWLGVVQWQVALLPTELLPTELLPTELLPTEHLPTELLPTEHPLVVRAVCSLAWLVPAERWRSATPTPAESYTRDGGICSFGNTIFASFSSSGPTQCIIQEGNCEGMLCNEQGYHLTFISLTVPLASMQL